MARSARRSRGTAGKNTRRIDFSKVGKAFQPGNEYAVKIVECSWEQGQKADYLNVKLSGLDPEYENSFMYHRASISDSSLWRFRPFLEAFAVEIPEGPMDVDPDDMVGRTAMCSTYLDKYDGGSSVKPDEFFPLDPDYQTDEAEDDEEEEAPPPKKSSRKAEPEPEPEPEEEEEAPPARKRRRKAEPEPEPEDDEEEEEAPPPKKAGKAKKKRTGVSEAEVDEMNEDELEDLVDQHDLEVELGDYRTLRKKRVAVKEALEENDLLED